MKHKKLFIPVLVVALMASLSACGGNKTNASTSTVSPSPSAETTVVPSTTPGSVNEKDVNGGDVTNPNNSVMPGDENHNGSVFDSTRENGSARENGSTHENGSARENGSIHENGSARENGSIHENGSVNENGKARTNDGTSYHEGSTAGEDLKRAGEDIGSAVGDVGRSVEDAVDGNNTDNHNANNGTTNNR